MVKQKWGCIYRLTNTTNGMKYIGKTIRYRKRMNEHKNSKNNHYVIRAICKYGWDAFKQEILIDDVPEEDLDNLEISYIEVENTMKPNGYNLTVGGGGISGYRWTEQAKKKRSQQRILFNLTRKQFGTVYFNKRYKKWIVKSAAPEKKHIGIYITEAKAREALRLYNETGKCMETDIKRKKGTGCIVRTPSGKYFATIMQNGKSNKKTFDTVEECEAFLDKCVKHFNLTGKQMEVIHKRRKKGTGCIVRTPSGNYFATITQNGKTKRKTFDTVEECEEFLKNC